MDIETYSTGGHRGVLKSLNFKGISRWIPYEAVVYPVLGGSRRGFDHFAAGVLHTIEPQVDIVSYKSKGYTAPMAGVLL